MVKEAELTETEDYELCPPVRGLPKTGQIVSYRSKDDGDYEAGWNEGTRFTDNGDGTISDEATGLMWPEDWCCDGANDGDLETWNDAIDWADALVFVGYSDWRLPNISELVTLLNYGAHDPTTYPCFLNTAQNRAWSSTTADGDTGQAIWASIAWGIVGADVKATLYALLAVRNI